MGRSILSSSHAPEMLGTGEGLAGRGDLSRVDLPSPRAEALLGAYCVLQPIRSVATTTSS